jgi:hypothetical protein
MGIALLADCLPLGGTLPQLIYTSRVGLTDLPQVGLRIESLLEPATTTCLAHQVVVAVFLLDAT